MKKLVLLSGALLSLGALSACGGKQAKEIDMSVSEMDEKFKIPDNLMIADDSFAQYAINSAEENLQYGYAVPRQTVYQRTTNLNPAVASGAARSDSVYDLSWAGEGEYKKGEVPIDSTAAYRNDYIETVSWYDNNLYEYTLSGKNKYTSEDGNTLNYKNVGSLYNYWPEEVQDKEGFYKIKNYVKESKAYKSGTFDYKTKDYDKEGAGYTLEEVNEGFKKQIGQQVSKMYMAIVNGQAGQTDVKKQYKVPEQQAIAEAAVVGKIDPSGPQFDLQLRFYRTQDYKSIYVYRSAITGVSFYYPVNNGGFSSSTDIIPIYSVQTIVGKVTQFSDNFHDWRVDYVGMFGKTYTVKDNNLVTYAKPKCVSSAYYYISSVYDSIGSKDYPTAEAEKATPYNNGKFAEEFKGFAIQTYAYDEYDGTTSDHPDGCLYQDLDNPNNSLFVNYSDMAGGAIEKKPEEGEAISLDASLVLTDDTIDFREENEGVPGIENKYHLHGSYSTPKVRRGVPFNPPKDWVSNGVGTLFGIIEKSDTDGYITKEDILKEGGNSLILTPSDGFSSDRSYGEFGGFCKEDGEESATPVPYTINNIETATYDIDITIKFVSNTLSVESVELYYNNGSVALVFPAEAEAK